jgi:hypothetical protein
MTDELRNSSSYFAAGIKSARSMRWSLLASRCVRFLGCINFAQGGVLHDRRCARRLLLRTWPAARLALFASVLITVAIGLLFERLPCVPDAMQVRSLLVVITSAVYDPEVPRQSHLCSCELAFPSSLPDRRSRSSASRFDDTAGCGSSHSSS